jgi:hypothetical protein
VDRNDFGTPLVSSIFEIAQREGKGDVLCFVNADIILMNDFMRAITDVYELHRSFLMVGRRWDLEVKELIAFDKPWQEMLTSQVQKEGKLHEATGIDFFVLKKGSWPKLPPFLVGRPPWDNWLIYEAKKLGVPVIDVTSVTTVIHQNHAKPEGLVNQFGLSGGPEASYNQRLGGPFATGFTISNADWILTRQGIRRPSITFGRLFRLIDEALVLRASTTSWAWCVQPMLAVRRVLQLGYCWVRNLVRGSFYYVAHLGENQKK